MIKAINPRELVRAGYGHGQRIVLAYGGRESRKFGYGTRRLAAEMRNHAIAPELLRVDNGGHSWRGTWRRAILFSMRHLGRHWQAELAVRNDLWLPN